MIKESKRLNKKKKEEINKMKQKKQDKNVRSKSERRLNARCFYGIIKLQKKHIPKAS